MKCSVLQLDECRVIVCGKQRIKACCKCGAIATRECDWRMRKLPSRIGLPGRMGTCDRGLCDSCTHSPAPEKDLCPEHKKAWEEHPANQQQEFSL